MVGVDLADNRLGLIRSNAVKF